MIADAPMVSIILPTYNGGAMLMRAVASLLRQTYTSFELLLIDDGSDDGSVTSIRASNDPRIAFLGDAARRGLVARLNEGIDAARGKYIARMDADDISFPNRLEKQVGFLDTYPDIDLVATRAIVFRNDDTLIGLLPFAATHEAICAHPWRGFPLAHPTWMGRAEWFRRFRYAIPEVKRAEDQDLLLRSFAISRFACLPDVLLAYHQGPFKLCRTLTARWHLLRAQQCYFIKNRQWVFTCKAFALTMIKTGIDFLAALPFCNQLYFARISYNVPEDIKQQFADIKNGIDS